MMTNIKARMRFFIFPFFTFGIPIIKEHTNPAMSAPINDTKVVVSFNVTIKNKKKRLKYRILFIVEAKKRLNMRIT